MKSDKSTELIDQVRQQMGDGKFSRAFATLKDLLASNPSHYEGRRLLATLLLKFGNLATARNAFETLVKEALQRQDYQEAESLLHEYLTAGPRCVSFLEMLGRAYELKGDPLAAVFEYEKAVDILVEDPDPERPAYAHDLFEKIKQLAPSSFVANRVAARLRLDASPQPSVTVHPDTSAEHNDTGPWQNSPTAMSMETEQGVVEENSGRNENDDEIVARIPETLTTSAPTIVEVDRSDEKRITKEPSTLRSEEEDKVPFPSVNRMPETPMAPPEVDVDETNAREFGSGPVYEPGHVGFYSDDPETTTSEPNVPLSSSQTTKPGGQSRIEPVPTFHHVQNETRQDLYWARAMQGTHSEATRINSSSNLNADEEDPRSSKPRRRFIRSGKAWLSFRVSIMTRSLIATTNSLTKLSIFVCLAIIAWVILIVGGTAALWLGLEQKPSETFQRLIDVAPTKTIEDWKNNGYVLLMGFGATTSIDPMQAGYDRWLSTKMELTPGCLDRMGKTRPLVRVPSNEQKPAEWFKTADPSAQFVAEAGQVKDVLDPEGSLMSRYRQWLNLPFEDWGFNHLGSLDCGHILTMHRLYLAEGFSQGLGVGMDRVETDLTAWRKVLAQARTVSMKAMAIDGINDDVAVMSGLLARPSIDNKITQRMIRLARPLDPEERSLRWPMQNEFALSVKKMEFRVRPQSRTDSSTALLVAKMPLPKQRTLNTYALYYDALIKAVGLPNALTPKLYEFSNTPARTWLDYGLNPIDNLILEDPGQDWQFLQGTIIETDARLRLAGLQARLRAPSSESLVARIAQAGPNFFDPFTELPMLINATRGTLYSVGADRKDDGGDPTFDVSVPFVQ